MGTLIYTAVYKENDLSFQIPFTDDASMENAITCYCTMHLGIDNRYIQEHIQN